MEKDTIKKNGKGRKLSLDTNVIYCGDCKDVLKRIPDSSMDLIFLDPPFFSQKEYEQFWIKDKTPSLGFYDTDWKKFRGSIDPTVMKEIDELKERWKDDGKGFEVYLGYMRERIEQCYRVLKPTGSIYLHCDSHAVHYLKCMLDEKQLFGHNCFRNAIIWKRIAAHNDPNRYGRILDHILFYTKTGNYTFNQANIPLQELWDDINKISTQSKERLDYPAQKPEALLKRIIEVSSNAGDIILDPFCGYGTTVAVAHKLGRKWIGVDISRKVCDITADRMRRIGFSPKIIGVRDEPAGKPSQGRRQHAGDL